jgi:general secretion pathway protein A
MYERFYNLRERPFSLSPDPDYLYPSRVHTEALNYLRYGIEGRAGFVVITGEIGSGKTTLLQTTLRGIDRRTSVARLVSTMLDARELVEAVMLDFGLDPPPGRSKPHLLRDLARFLVDQRQAGRLALLIIDEAQNLSQAALEEVRMLSNLETEKSKLIQIVLVGQPNLHDLLARPELEQLRQRVTVRYHLRPLDPSETAAYVNHRLRKAAIGAPLVFSKEVTDLIERSSQGLPRKINVIADAILLFGYGEDKGIIDAELTREVIAELEATGVIAAPDRVSPVAVPARASSETAPSADAAPAAVALTAAPQAVETPTSASDLSVREAHVALRERQLAEQHRILTEQYRILKMRESQATANAARAGGPLPAKADGPASAVETPPPAAAAAAEAPTSAPSLTRAPLVATTFRGATAIAPATLSQAPEASGPGLWTRMRRGLFGVGKPVLED